MQNISAYLNRPFVAADFAEVARSSWACDLKSLVAKYREAGLPVLNGSFEYSNFFEGPAQLSTLHPYRLWEYSSLALVSDRIPVGCRVLDVGGAGSPLPYFLAERGHDVLAVDLQPLLVTLCNHVANARKLSLHALVADVTEGLADSPTATFDLITCISVLEHIDRTARRTALCGIAKLVKPGGLFYLTFDYGDHFEATKYRNTGESSSSISNVEQLCEDLDYAGFGFLGNDPRLLPPAVLNERRSPGSRELRMRMSLNVGVVDSSTRWRTLAKYVIRRLLRARPATTSRYESHNFFRIFAIRTDRP